jgi:hypothetical protein
MAELLRAKFDAALRERLPAALLHSATSVLARLASAGVRRLPATLRQACFDALPAFANNRGTALH